MEFLLQNWFLIAAAIVSGGLLLWPQLSGAQAEGIAPAEAVRLLNKERAVFIDVSEPDEFKGFHAAQARNVPLGSVATAGQLPANKDTPLVMFCPRGARAAKAAALARKQGHTRVSVLKGGTNAWQEANLPVEKA